jgi:transcriptional regulator with XRE-family HTH domain
MKTGQTIKILRTALGVSQGSLARCLGISPGYLSLVEQDKREPSLSFLRKIGAYFDVPAGFFMLDTNGLQPANHEYRRLIGEIRRAMIDYVISRPEPATKSKRRMTHR